MYKILAILLFTATLCYGQGKYTVRKTYQTHNDWDNNTCVQTIKYYYDDTLLTTTIESHNFSDTAVITRYFYNATHQLVKTESNTYEIQVKSCLVDEEAKSEWGDTIITHYIYNSKGQVEEEIIRYKKNVNTPFISGGMCSKPHTNRVVYKYDASNRILSKEEQHIYKLNDRDVELYANEKYPWPDTTTITKTTYRYLKDRLIKEIRDLFFGVNDSIVILYTYDKFGKIIAELEYNNESMTYISTLRKYHYMPDKRIYEQIYTQPDYVETTRYIYE